MAKFCTKCGNPLEDGKCPECDKEKEVKEEKVEEKKDVKEEVASNDVVNNFKDIVTNIFKTPIRTVKKYANEANMNFGLIALGVNAVAIGLFVYATINNILKVAGITIQQLNVALDEIRPYLQVIGINIQDTNFGVKAAIAMAIISAIVIGIIYLMANVVFKKELNVKKIIPIVGVSESFITIAALAGAVLSYINIPAALIVFLVVSIFSFTTLHQTLDETTNLDSNEIIYTTAAAIIVPIIALIIITSVLAGLYATFLSAAKYAKMAVMR